MGTNEPSCFTVGIPFVASGSVDPALYKKLFFNEKIQIIQGDETSNLNFGSVTSVQIPNRINFTSAIRETDYIAVALSLVA